jgi:hypothetical protein
MKKFGILSICAAMLALTACNDNDATIERPILTIDEVAPMRFYGVATPEDTRGAAQHDRLWHNGTTIKVKFLNGSPEVQAIVEQYAQQWETYANIDFKFVAPTEDAHIRVGFDWNNNRFITWSYIGTDCKTVTDQSEATMSFTYLEYLPEDEARGDVLRAFGQALGLELESRNVNFTPQWNPTPNAVSRYWGRDITDIEWAELKKYVFDPLDADNEVCSEYDPASIMRWPFPSNILLKNDLQSFNTELSDLDKAFIAQLYPRDEKFLAKFVFGSDYGGLNLNVTEANAVFISYNGGAYEDAHNHPYWNGTVEAGATITVRGNAKALTGIFTWGPITSLDISGCTYLKDLADFKLSGIESIDLSNCPLLEIFHCYHNQLTSLDLSQNPMIMAVYCDGNPIVKDKSALVALAKSLPNRRGQLDPGKFAVGELEHPEWIADILAEKNWLM